jgi:hypothetical protein
VAGRIEQNSLLISLLAGNLVPETGSQLTASSARQSGRNYARAREIRTSWAHSLYRVQSLCAVSGTESVISALCLREPFRISFPPGERLAGLLHRNDYGATVFLPSRAACAQSGKASSQ